MTSPNTPTAPAALPGPDLSASPALTAAPWSLRRGLVLASGICALVVALAVGVGGWAVGNLAAARVLVVDQVDPALMGYEQLSNALINQETGVRGYVGAGRPDFLAPYQDGLDAQDNAVTALRGLAADAPRLKVTSGLDQVLAAARAWRDAYADPAIAAVGAGRPPPDPGVGKARFDAVRTALDSQRRSLITARVSARAALDSASATLLGTCVAIAVALVILLAGLTVWISRVITTPIAELAATVRGVSNGGFDRVITGRGPRELTELAADIDSMRARILEELAGAQTLNDQLGSRTEELGRSNRDLEQFAYIASHDLQEPLRKVSGFCELLQSRYADQLDERADQYIGFAVDGARRMSALINDLLAFSRVRRESLDRTLLDGDTLLAQAIRNLATPITDTEARITHDPLPPITGEASLLVAVFQNLIGNALKFCGERPPSIQLTVRRNGDNWLFRIADNGIGIEPAYAEKIFTIFQRLHAKADYPGTGIGLAMCRKILEYHGGTIWLDTHDTTPADTTPADASGAVFYFTLPATEPEPAAVAAAIHPSPSALT